MDGLLGVAGIIISYWSFPHSVRLAPVSFYPWSLVVSSQLHPVLCGGIHLGWTKRQNATAKNADFIMEFTKKVGGHLCKHHGITVIVDVLNLIHSTWCWWDILEYIRYISNFLKTRCYSKNIAGSRGNMLMNPWTSAAITAMVQIW